jgi:hypothetical protein
LRGADDAVIVALKRKRSSPDPTGTAAAIRHLIEAAEEPDWYWRTRGIEPPLRAAAVIEARDDLLAVAQLLDEQEELPEATVACADWLAWAETSPVCSEPVDDADVADVAARLRAALEATAATPAGIRRVAPARP